MPATGRALSFGIPIAMVCVASALLAGCENGGSPKSVRRYFGSHHWGECEALDVRVPIDNSNFTVVRDEAGDFDCAPAAAVTAAGCDFEIDIDESDGHQWMHVRIEGCVVGEAASLFDCAIVGDDREEIEGWTDATCDCEHDAVCVSNGFWCDRDPHVCVNTVESPFCELCGNDADDDGDGASDCDDLNCKFTSDCGYGRGSTTITCTSTTQIEPNTTLPTVPVTSTTVPVEPSVVRFRLESAVAIGSLQFVVDYAAAPGQFVGTGGSVQCASMIDGSLASANDLEGERKLTIGLISLDGFTGPADIMECGFVATVAPTAEDFVVHVEEASDPDLNPIAVPTVVAVVPAP